MGGLKVVVAAVAVAGAGPPDPGAAARARQALAAAGHAVVPPAEAAEAVRWAYAGDAGGAWPADDLRAAAASRAAALRAGEERYYAKEYDDAALALEAAAAAAADGDPPLDALLRVRPQLKDEWIRASLTLARARREAHRGRERAAGRDAASDVVLAVARRFPDAVVTEAEFPKDLVVALAEALRAEAVRTGALDVDVAGAGERCSVHLDGALRGFHPVRLDREGLGRRTLTVVCEAGDGARLVRSRPLVVDVVEGRTAVRVAPLGEGAVALADGGDDVVVRRSPGWSAGGPATEAAALAARTNADVAVLVGPDPAAPPVPGAPGPLGVGVRALAIRAGGGAHPGISRLLAPAGPPGASSARRRSNALLWTAGGLLLAGAATAATAVAAGGDLAACRRDPGCAGTDRHASLRGSLAARSAGADLLLVTSGAAAVLWWAW